VSISKKEEAMSAFLKECLGMSIESLKKTFEADSDWTLVIKLHAYVEASLNFLIVNHFGDRRLEQVISRLDISDRRRGKLAFIKALELLPSEYRSFIQKFSEIRNLLAHDVKNVDFDLKAYLDGLDAKQYKELADAIVPMRWKIFGKPRTPDIKFDHKWIKLEPRYAILHGTLAIMLHVYEKHQVRDFLSPPPPDIGKHFLGGSSHDKPIPKES